MREFFFCPARNSLFCIVAPSAAARETFSSPGCAAWNIQRAARGLASQLGAGLIRSRGLAFLAAGVGVLWLDEDAFREVDLSG